MHTLYVWVCVLDGFASKRRQCEDPQIMELVCQNLGNQFVSFFNVYYLCFFVGGKCFLHFPLRQPKTEKNIVRKNMDGLICLLKILCIWMLCLYGWIKKSCVLASSHKSLISDCSDLWLIIPMKILGCLMILGFG